MLEDIIKLKKMVKFRFRIRRTGNILPDGHPYYRVEKLKKNEVIKGYGLNPKKVFYLLETKNNDNSVTNSQSKDTEKDDEKYAHSSLSEGLSDLNFPSDEDTSESLEELKWF